MNPDSTFPPPSEAPTLRDLDALAWSLDLDQDVYEEIAPPSAEATERGRRA
jgi:hypothetical protein